MGQIDADDGRQQLRGQTDRKGEGERIDKKLESVEKKLGMKLQK